MKKICILTFAALMLIVSNLHAQKHNWANYQRYEQANKEVTTAPNKNKRVIFMGNSITEGWVSKRPQFFADNNYIGRGISGQTSYQFLLRFRDDVINLHPKVVVINAGTNDVAENSDPYNEERTFGNIVSMVELARANKIKVILTSTLPAAGFGWNKSITNAGEKIVSLNERLKEYARKHKIPYVDYHSVMVHGEKQGLNPAYSKDGVHPTAEGYAVMEPMIHKAIQKML